MAETQVSNNPELATFYLDQLERVTGDLRLEGNPSLARRRETCRTLTMQISKISSPKTAKFMKKVCQKIQNLPGN